MQVGDVVFVRGHNLLERCIEYFDKGSFSHVCIAVSETHIVEAQYGTKCHISPMTYSDTEIVPLNLTPEQQNQIITSAIQHCGELYDLEAIFYFVLHGKLPALRPNHLVCSELVTSVLTEAGLWSGSEVITPNELYIKLKILGGR